MTLYIYIVAYSRPHGCTEWAEIVCGHSGAPGGCFRLKRIIETPLLTQRVTAKNDLFPPPLTLNELL